MRFVSDILAKGGLVVDGSVTLTTTPNATVDTDKFLVQDGTVVKYRTGAEVLLDIGAQGALTLTTTGTTGGATLSGNTLNIPIYQGQITLTVTGSSGSSTLVGNTLNIPTYTLVGLGGVPSTRTINGLALSADQTFATGTTGTDFNIVSAGTVHTFNIPDASSIARGLINATTQTINGTKTFLNSPIVPSLYLTNMGAGSGAVYYNVSENRLTLANYNAGGEIKFEVNGGSYTMELNSDLTINLTGYTTDGFLKTSGSTGLLIVDTTTYTPTSRTLTINGTSYDLSANRTWSVGTVTSVGLSVPTGFSVASTPVTTSGTIALSFASGYSLPTNASQTNWDTAYNSRISSLTTTGTSGAATLVSNVLNIPIYQAQGSYITSLTGEATGSGPGATTVTLTNSAVIGKVLTGLSVTSGSIAATDSILQAFGKIQGQLNALAGGLQYQGVWNANTNTPTITSGVGTDGYFYIVNVAGNTTIDGNTGWQVGDWIVFDGSVWQKVDNTDSVTSVNGFTGAVVLTTTNISEGTNLYYTDARARQAISLTTTGSSGAATYSNVTGILNIPQYTLTGLGGVPTTRTLTINGTAYDLSADRSWSVGTVTSIATSGPITGGTITGSGTIGITQATSTTSGYLSSTDWNTFNNKQNAITLTVTGSSGPATLVGATLNIPEYTLSGLGGVPSTRTLTINGTSYDLSANRTWSVGTVTSITFNGPLTGGTITGSGTVGITQSSGSTDGYLSSIDWNTFNSKEPAIAAGTTAQYWRGDKSWQTLNTSAVPEGTNLYYTDARARQAISLTTSGTTGAATYSNITGVFNIPQYQGALTLTTTGTSGAATLVGNTLNIPQYQSVLTNPVTGTGTTNYVARWTGTNTLGTGVLYDNGTNVGINVTSLTARLQVNDGATITGANSGVTGLRLVTNQNNGLEWYLGHSVNGYNGWVANAKVNNSGGNWADGYLEFCTAGAGGASVTTLTLKNGNVGINNNSPGFKLHVDSGAVTAAGLKVTKQTTGDGISAYFVNESAGAYSSYIYIGSSPGTDWKLGKNVTNIASSTDFNIVDSSNNVRLHIFSGTGNTALGSTTDSGLAKLQVTGAIQQTSVTSSMLKTNSSGVLVAAVAGTDYLTSTSSDFSYNASLTISTSWQDSGVSNSNLTTNGVYLVTVTANDAAVAGYQYSETYIGLMYWYASNTNNENYAEISLHHMGHADNDRCLYLRTKTTSAAAGSFLQVKGNYTTTGNSTYTFTFKRLM